MKRTLLLTVCLLLSAGYTFSQFVGIGEAAPNSKVDIVNGQATGNSIEVNHNSAANVSSAVWVRNNGIGRGLNLHMLNTANNIPAIQVSQVGANITARGMEIDMPAAGTAMGMGVWQPGTGMGFYSQLTNAGSTSSSYYGTNAGTGYGITNWNSGTGSGIYNDMATGLGLFNVVRSSSIGTYNLLEDAGGTGTYTDLDVMDGIGSYVSGVDNVLLPTAGGDMFGFMGTVRTVTPTIGVTVYGAVFAGEQHGRGHGILITHSGAQGRNAEFNITNPANTDAAIFAVHNGQGSAIIAQNQNNFIAGTITVADFSYTGTDVADHIGVAGSSTPTAGWGIGVEGTGNWYGVHGVGGSYGMFCTGNFTATGAKAFTIDHPTDPANKILRHFSIESNEVLNMYRGMVELGADGRATVELPDYFELINKDYSYQLTAVGTPQQPYVYEEITGNHFVVAGEPGSKVSWTVYADRNDRYMRQNPEGHTDVAYKHEMRKGKYFEPEVHGQPASAGMFYREDAQTTQSSSVIGGGMKSDLQESMDDIRKKAQQGGPEILAPVSEQEEETGTH